MLMMMKGGKVLGSGTYGCILKPAVPCLGSTTRPPNTLSKLMMNYNALDEMQEIINISQITKKIPDHNQYYILNQIRICPPENLTREDKIDFNKKCTAMTNKGIKENQINDAIDKNHVGILQLPDGGFDITHYLAKGNLTEKKFTKLNEALLKLLVGGISPLNKVGVLHQDIKAPNIVYSESNSLARLIDWGLSTTFKGSLVPKNVRGWPVMYNAGFGVLVFHQSIQKTFQAIMATPKMRAEVAKYKYQNVVEKMHPMVKEALRQIIFENYKSVARNIGGIGHIYYLESVLKNIVELSPPSLSQEFVDSVNKSPFTVLSQIICDHLAKIFLTFSLLPSNTIGKFRDAEFFSKVYKKNCDIIGFISCYYDLMNNKYTTAERRYKAFKIIMKYQLSPKFATTPIDVHDVVKTISEAYLPNKQLAIEVVPPAETVKQPGAPPPPVMVQEERTLPKDNFTWSLTRRCPKGYRRNKKTQKCTKTIDKTKQKRCPNGTRRNKTTGRCEYKHKESRVSKTNRHRCPNGTRINKKTGKCESK